MKNIIYLIIALLVFNSCSENNTSNSDGIPLSTIIIGTIDNAPYPNIIFSDDNNRLEAQVANGKFLINTTISQPALYAVTYGRDKSTVFLNPGDTLSLKADGQRFSRSINFEGKLGQENIYINEKTLLDRQRYSTKVKDYKLTETEFIAAMNYSRQQNQSEFDKATQEKKFNPAFIKLMNHEIAFEWASDRINYKLYHEFYNKVENLELSENYFDFLNELSFDDANLLGSVKYKEFISNYVNFSVQEELKSNDKLRTKDNGDALAKFDFVNENFKDPEVKNFLLYSTLKQHIRREGANGTQELIDLFVATNQNENHKADILKDYSIWENLKEGVVAPTFNYADINGKFIGLENFKGKFVYIDIWATWCGPCIKELPFLEELQEKYNGNDKIVFTSISIDQDTEKWRTMVSDQQMKGVQLLADQAWQSSIVRDYKISGIPRFLLIGPNGDIISVNAPRPSSERIKTKLASLIDG